MARGSSFQGSSCWTDDYSKGKYFHSSGKDNGRNGIALDSILDLEDSDKISKYYRSRLISAGRVTKSYLWNKTIR